MEGERFQEYPFGNGQSILLRFITELERITYSLCAFGSDSPLNEDIFEYSFCFIYSDLGRSIIIFWNSTLLFEFGKNEFVSWINKKLFKQTSDKTFAIQKLFEQKNILPKSML